MDSCEYHLLNISHLKLDTVTVLLESLCEDLAASMNFIVPVPYWYFT